MRNFSSGHDGGHMSFFKLANKTLKWAEIVIAFFLFVLVILGLFSLVQSIFLSDGHLFEHFHDDFERILGNILLLIVALELALLLVKHRIESIVEIMFFVIARKFAVQTHQVYEMAIGVFALAGLFAVRKYLMKCVDCMNNPIE